ncbi:MAG TPA: methyltransferase domain-containing protein [Cellvibrio sp.]
MNFSHKENAKVLFNKNQIGEYWNNLYQDVSSCLDYHFVRRLEITTQIIQSVAVPSEKILDLGCGSGVLSERLLDSGYSVDAADMSEDMREFTQKRLAKFDAEKYKIFYADCEKLDFSAETYDLVACIGVFGYLDEVDQAIAEIYRVLKPGGKLVMSIRNEDNLNIFDIQRVLKNIFIKIPNKILKRLFSDKNKSSVIDGNAAPDSRKKHFINIWDRPRDVIGIFNHAGFRLRQFEAVGYGPIQYRGKSLLPEVLSKSISAGLDNFFRATGLYRQTKWFADISIYMFEK